MIDSFENSIDKDEELFEHRDDLNGIGGGDKAGLQRSPELGLEAATTTVGTIDGQRVGHEGGTTRHWV